MFLAFGVYSLTIGQVRYPQGWEDYPDLAKYSKAYGPGLANMDAMTFELIPGDTRISHLHRTGQHLPEEQGIQYPKFTGNGGLRKPFYLSHTEPFSIEDPPANSSAQTRAELDFLLLLQSRRTEENIRASKFFASVFYRTSTKPGDADYERMQRNLFHIGRSVAPWFNADSLPVTAELVRRVWTDASYILWKCKNHFVRIRPYKLDPAMKNLEETNWAAYPSGHATNFYTNAYLFSELLPEYSSFFIKDAYDMAHSREILGVHYPSDSESGRLLGYELIQKLKQNPAFQSDFEKAKLEIEAMKRRKGYRS